MLRKWILISLLSLSLPIVHGQQIKNIDLAALNQSSEKVPTNLKWYFDIGAFTKTPVLDKTRNIVYTQVNGELNAASRLYAIDPDGNQKWMVFHGKSQYRSPILDTAGNLVQWGKNEIISISPDGSIRWHYKQAKICNFLVGHDNTIYISDTKKVTALSSDGALKWEANYLSDGNILCYLKQNNLTQDKANVLYVPTERDLIAISPDGIIKWKQKNDNSVDSVIVHDDGAISYRLYENSKDVLVTLDSDKIIKWKHYFTDQDFLISMHAYHGDLQVKTNGNIYTFDANGNIKWKLNDNANIIILSYYPLFSEEGNIYFIGSENSDSPAALYKVGPNGTILWKSHDQLLDHVKKHIIRANGRIFVTSYDSKTYNTAITVFNENGRTVCHYENLKWGFSTPQIGNDGTIYHGGNNGIYALNPCRD